jgi:anti-sigma B factor antagonist
MDTAVGVFASRERAEEAVKLLLESHIPEDRIVFLTRSENDARTISEQLAAAGGTRGVAHLSLRDVGPTFASGPGAASSLDLPAARATGATAENAVPDPKIWASGLGNNSIEDLAFFRKILRDGHSVIVVRTASSHLAASACEILDKLAFSMKKNLAAQSTVTFRRASGAAVAEFVGKIAFTEGPSLLRETVYNFLVRGYRRILLDLRRVDFIDSAGLGELVRADASVRNRGGRLTLIRPSSGIQDLLRLTKLDRVFDIAPDEFTALRPLKSSDATNSLG